MPRHEQVSPEEDLASFYGDQPPATRPPALGATPPPVPPDATSAPSFEPTRTAGGVVPVQRPMPNFPPPAAPAVPQPVNSALAAVISFFLPGAGQIYAGQTIKGVVLLVLAFFTCMGGGILNVLAAIDAYLIAERKSRGETVGDWQFF